MTTFAVDMESAPRYGLAECKAHLSELVADAERAETSCIIMRYGKPAALLVPIPASPKPSGRARGSLASFANPSRREREEGAFERAMVEKHARP